MISLQNKIVAVTGIGLITPSVQSFAEVLNGNVVILDTDLKEVASVPVPDGQSSRELRRLSKLARMSVCAADQALKMSGKTTESMGLGVALTHGSTSYLAEFHDLMIDYGPDSASPSAFSNGVTNAPLSTISTLFKLTSGGITFTGLESAGIDLLNYAADSVLNNEYESFLAGSAEEYSQIVDSVYSGIGWYNGRIPDYLPSDNPGLSGFGISEGSAFVVIEKLTEENRRKAICLYSPQVDETFEADLIFSGAGGGPQDLYEIEALKKRLIKSKSDVAFTSAAFGNSFALCGLLSTVLASACLQCRKNLISSERVHPELVPYIKQVKEVTKVIIQNVGRDGQAASGLLINPNNM